MTPVGVTVSSVSARRAPLAAVVPQQEVRQALGAGQLVLHYQPIIDLDSGRTRGAEALLRWSHPSGSLLYPDDFLPAVAHTKVMGDLTRWALRTACTAAAHWPSGTVSVNISALDLTRRDFVAEVRTALRESALPGERLVIELTEHAVVQDVPLAAQVLRRLREEGVGVSLDDFGTGYSSLFYLRELPITEVKIDRVFIASVESSEEDAAIVESILRLARAVGLGTVAEGVERPGQAAALRAMGCPAGQGHLWGAANATVDISRAPFPMMVAHRTRRRPTKGEPPHTPETLDQIRAMVEAGASLHTIAAALNRGGVATSWGTRWTAASVARAVTAL